MRRLRSFLLRLCGVVGHRRDDFEAELAAHLQLHIDDNLRAGMRPEEARRVALLRLGGVTQTEERVRDQRGLPFLDTTMQDVRYAVRSLRRNPTFTVVAILTLALGIGATTAIFSLVDGVLLRPAPFGDLPRLMMVWETDRSSGTSREAASIPDYVDFQQRAHQLVDLSALSPLEMNLTGDQTEPGRLAGLSVTHGFLRTVGLTPMLGRAFTPAEDRPDGPPAVIISEDLWERVFARDPAALGRRIRLNDVDAPVVGVMPRGSDFGTLQLLAAAAYGRGFAERGGRPRADVWMPLRPNPAANRANHPIFLVARLAPGATVASAQAEMARIAGDLEQAFPVNGGRGTFIEPLEGVVFGPVRPALYVLLAAVGLVLLVASINVANLLLVRASDRVREVTVRAALGAGLGRLAQQFFAEGAVLAGAGVALGVPLAYASLHLLVSLAPPSLPRVDLVRIDARVLAATLAISALVAVVFGLLPLLSVRRIDLQQSLHGSAGGGQAAGREASRVRSAFAIGELAMATMLMIGAGLLVRSLWALQNVDTGFSASGVLKAEFQLPSSRYPQNFANFPRWPERARFGEQLIARLSALPGVQSAAVAGANPLDAGFTSSIRIAGRETEGRGWPEPSVRTVGESYFSTVRVPILAGRAFAPGDTPGAAPVMVINEAANQRFFGGRGAIGTAVTLWGSSRTIVGIVGNERIKGLTEPPPPAVYLPFAQAPIGSAVLVRTAGDPLLLAGEVRRVVREIDPQLPVFGVEPLTETLGNSQAQRRFTMVVLIVFSGVALLLAVIGVHGVLSYTVAQRTREIGIRVALGADLTRIRRLVLTQGATLAAVGIVVGLGSALVLTRLLTTLLFGVGPRDPFTFASVGIVLGLVALVASWVPARRAARLDPIEALRSE